MVSGVSPSDKSAFINEWLTEAAPSLPLCQHIQLMIKDYKASNEEDAWGRTPTQNGIVLKLTSLHNVCMNPTNEDVEKIVNDLAARFANGKLPDEELKNFDMSRVLPREC